MGVSALLAVVLAVMGPFQVAPISGGDAFTLPSNRHLVRLQPAGLAAFDALDAWLTALGNLRNPGTSADLVTACLFAALRQQNIKLPIRF